MTAIWTRGADGRWRTLQASSLQDEATLQRLVADAPHMLTLSGSPKIAILGAEVRVGSGWADLVAVESSGRVVIIEVKLERNPESRRAVIAQALSYAAALKGTGVDVFERDVLGEHLRQRRCERLEDVFAHDGEEIDAARFRAGVDDSLRRGAFRLVLVLDSAPEDLVQVAGFLESTTKDRLVIDVVTVGHFEVGGERLLVPQRMDAERMADGALARRPAAPSSMSSGARVFEESIGEAAETDRPTLRRLTDWALALERDKLVCLESTKGVGRWVLRLRLPDEGVSLVSIWNDKNPSLGLHSTVLRRRAPSCFARLESLLGSGSLGQGKTVRDFRDEVLAAIRAGYGEALDVGDT